MDCSHKCTLYNMCSVKYYMYFILVTLLFEFIYLYTYIIHYKELTKQWITNLVHQIDKIIPPPRQNCKRWEPNWTCDLLQILWNNTVPDANLIYNVCIDYIKTSIAKIIVTLNCIKMIVPPHILNQMQQTLIQPKNIIVQWFGAIMPKN